MTAYSLIISLMMVCPQMVEQQDSVTVKELKQVLTGLSGSEMLYDVALQYPDSTAAALLELSPFEFSVLLGEAQVRLSREEYNEMAGILGHCLPQGMIDELPRVEEKFVDSAQPEVNIDSLYKVYSARCSVIYEHLQDYTVPEVGEVYEFLLITPRKFNMVETEEWTSEIQYAMLQCFPQRMMDGINMLTDEQRADVLKELSMPIHDGFDFSANPGQS